MPTKEANKLLTIEQAVPHENGVIGILPRANPHGYDHKVRSGVFRGFSARYGEYLKRLYSQDRNRSGWAYAMVQQIRMQPEAR